MLAAHGHHGRMDFTASSFETIEVTEADDDIVLVTLNRPDRLNAITSTMITELEQVVRAVDLDPSVRAVIVTGAGRGFSAGLDLQCRVGRPEATVSTDRAGFHVAGPPGHAARAIHRSRKPWLAAINGPSVGGGFSLGLACDIRFARRAPRSGRCS